MLYIKDPQNSTRKFIEMNNTFLLQSRQIKKFIAFYIPLTNKLRKRWWKTFALSSFGEMQPIALQA